MNIILKLILLISTEQSLSLYYNPSHKKFPTYSKKIMIREDDVFNEDVGVFGGEKCGGCKLCNYSKTYNKTIEKIISN